MAISFVERQLVSLDWDLRTLRVVHFVVRSKGGVRIRKVLSVAIPPDLRSADPAQFGQLIRDVLARERIGARRMVVDVPRDQAVLNTLRLPAVSVDELPAMVEFQVSKELPFPLSAAVVDFATANGADEAGQREVLVAAVRHEVLDYYTQVAQAAGLKLDRVGLRPYANREAINELLGDTRRERVLFVDVGPALTEIDVLRDGRLAFSRAASALVPRISAGEAAAAPATQGDGLGFGLRLQPASATTTPAHPAYEHVVQSLLVEVTRSIEAYRAGDPGASMDHVVVGGDSGVEDELLEAIKRRFGITGERYNPTASFGWDAGAGIAAGGFAAALGLALGHAVEGRLDFDFAHPKRTVTQTRRRLNKAPLAAAVALLFVTAGLVAYAKVVGPKKKLIAELVEDIAQAKARVDEYKKFEEMVTRVEEFESEQVIWVDELRDFFSVFPEHDKIVLKDLEMSQPSQPPPSTLQTERLKPSTIKAKLECKGQPIADEAVTRLEELRAPDQNQPRFDAQVSDINDQAGEYPVRAALNVTLINRGGRPARDARGSDGAP